MKLKKSLFIPLMGISLILSNNVSASLVLPSSNGNYTVKFIESDSSDYDFVHKNLQSDGSIADVYYKISYTPAAEAADQVREVNTGTISYDRDFVEINNVSTIYSTSFVNDYDVSLGGAINNASTGNITSITGDFIKNSNTIDRTAAMHNGSIYAIANGGAIYNYGSIGDITSNFIGNYAYAKLTGEAFSSNSISMYTYAFPSGGAVYNGDYSTIGNIFGSFIGNYALSESIGGEGTSTSGTINIAVTSESKGGAVYSGFGAIIGDITGNFIGNYASAVSTGGEVYSDSTSNIYPRANASANSSGGAVYNYYSFIGDIVGKFIGNHASATAIGGSVLSSSSGTMDASANVSAYGGAIYNTGQIGNIIGDFIGNYVFASVEGGSVSAPSSDAILAEGTSSVSGGVIHNNDGTIGNIIGNFIGNYASSVAVGGTTGSLSGTPLTYVNAYADAFGGVIDSGLYYSVIGNITGNFIGNYASAKANGGTSNSDMAFANANANVKGGVIYNRYGTIGDITGNFIGNYASAAATGGTAASNSSVAEAYATTQAYGGAIYNLADDVTIKITGDFINNYASAIAIGGAANSTSGTANAYAVANAYGGAIYNAAYSAGINITGSFIGNYASASATAGTASGSTVDITETAEAKGGAIYNEYGTITISSTSDTDVLFEDNYVTTDGGVTKQLNSIYVERGTINFATADGSIIDIRDAIAGEDGEGILNKTGLGTMYLWGDNSGYSGIFNVNEGTFALMFDEDDTTWNERNTANMSNTTITFADDTVYRPRVSESQLASLNSSLTTVGSNVLFLPYDLSALTAGQHIYDNDYYNFEGWTSPLASIDTTYNGSTQTEINVSNLAGYEGLTTVADIYRMRSDLSYEERYMLDYLYYSGVVTQDILDMFEVLEGDDYINYEQIHRGSVRQFGRQVISRVQNRNCPNCKLYGDSRDDHMWFNVSQNSIKKSSSGSGPGYSYNPTGFALGYDHDINNYLTAGLAFSYATGEAKTSSRSHGLLNKNDTDEYLVSFYGKYRYSIRPYVSWNTGLGLIQNDTKFQTSTIDSRGKYDTYAFFANVETGYDFGNACNKLEPYIGLEYTRLTTEGYSERGVGARHFDRMTWDIVEIPVGIRSSHDFYAKSYILTPALDVAYARNVGDTSASTTAMFVGNPGQTWNVSSVSEKRDTFRGNVNFKINNLDYPVALNLGYGIDYRSDYYDQQVYATLRWDF